MAEEPASTPESISPSESLEPSATTEIPPTEAAPAEASASTTAVADPAAPAAEVDPFAAMGEGGAFDQAAIDELLKQANFEDPTALPSDEPAASMAAAPETSSFELPNFQQAMQDAQV